MSDKPQTTCILCKDCKHFIPEKDGRGSCSKWIQKYDFDSSKLKSNDCWVESDEGWCMNLGPEFGCVLGELK